MWILIFHCEYVIYYFPHPTKDEASQPLPQLALKDTSWIPPDTSWGRYLLHFLSHQQSTGTRPFSTCRPRNQYVVQSSDLKLLTRKQYIQRHSAGFPVHLKEVLIKNQAASHLRAASTLHSSAVHVGIQAVLQQTTPRKRTMKLKL